MPARGNLQGRASSKQRAQQPTKCSIGNRCYRATLSTGDSSPDLPLLIEPPAPTNAPFRARPRHSLAPYSPRPFPSRPRPARAFWFPSPPAPPLATFNPAAAPPFSQPSAGRWTLPVRYVTLRFPATAPCMRSAPGARCCRRGAGAWPRAGARVGAGRGLGGSHGPRRPERGWAGVGCSC